MRGLDEDIVDCIIGASPGQTSDPTQKCRYGSQQIIHCFHHVNPVERSIALAIFVKLTSESLYLWGKVRCWLLAQTFLK
jgi:hypothetical protein